MKRHRFKVIPNLVAGVGAGTLSLWIKCVNCGEEQLSYHHRPPTCVPFDWRKHEPDPWSAAPIQGSSSTEKA